MIRSKADVVESQEVELRLELPPGEIEAFRHAPVLGDPARQPVDQVSTYFDTGLEDPIRTVRSASPISAGTRREARASATSPTSRSPGSSTKACFGRPGSAPPSASPR
jgi:hypothetical protein